MARKSSTLPAPVFTPPQTPSSAGVIHCTEDGTYRGRVMLGTITMGLVRIEWHEAMVSLVTPTSFTMGRCTPTGFLIPDGQNICVQQTLDSGCEWLWLVEDDTCPPPLALVQFREHFRKKTGPLISGLYYQRNGSQEPLIYREDGPYYDWKRGDLVWASGVPTGCLMIHRSVLQVLYDEAEPYTIRANGAEVRVRKVFDNPERFEFDPASSKFGVITGTTDLDLCQRIIKNDVLTKAGWPKHAKKKYPFAVDSRIHCRHLDRETGMAF